MLEDAAIDVLKQATSTFTDVDAVVRSVVVEEAKAITDDGNNLTELKREHQILDDQIDFYVRQMGMLGAGGVSQKTDPLRNKLRDVRNRIDMVERLATSSKVNVDEIVERVKQNCTKIMESLEGLGRLQIRHLLQGLIKKIVVDLETRETTMEVHMPSWMVTSDSNVIERVCAENATAQTGVFGANDGWAIPIGTYSCVAQRVESKFCMDCRRTTQTANTAIPTGIAA